MHILSIITAVSLLSVTGFKGNATAGKKITIIKHEPAQNAYDKGFAKGVMREGDKSVKLWNRVLIENDSPGAGNSEKGTLSEPVYGKIMIKKILHIEDPRCAEASVVFYYAGGEKHPVTVTVNGYKTSSHRIIREGHIYVPVDPSSLKKGNNEIILSCPEAENSGSGWHIFLSRIDEFKAGGWDPEKMCLSYEPVTDEGITAILGKKDIKRYPKNLGDYSLVSSNGGKKWSVRVKSTHKKASHEKNDAVGEYTLRLNMKQYIPEGILVSPVIDLWSDPEKNDAVIPFSTVESLKLTFSGTSPQGTSITWQMRAGVTMDPLKTDDWTEWITLASGAEAAVKPAKRVDLPPAHWDPERSLTLPKVRYIQWRALLRTDNPINSPTVDSVSISCEVTRRMEVPENIIIRDFHNPEILYSSTGFTYQSPDEPMNKIVIDRDDIDSLLEGAGSEFEAVVRLLDYASRRWVYGGPYPEYPKWNTVDTAERVHSAGGGGMCIQFAEYLVHMLTVKGFHARHVNILYHEVVEVWSNDFDKWVYLDPTQGIDCYFYDMRTGIPLSLREMHEAYYEFYNVTKPIDWMKPLSEWHTNEKEHSKLPIACSTTDPRIALWIEKNGPAKDYTSAAYLRIMPRNNFSTTTFPEPLTQGMMTWPWDGYINWYDEFAPPKLQYSQHTDRECDFWQTLNRVRFEAVPEINGDAIFIRMITFTPGFETFQVRVDRGEWEDSDERYVWRLHYGNNRLEMRAKSAFGVYGHPSHIECNFVAKPVPRPVTYGSME